MKQGIDIRAARRIDLLPPYVFGRLNDLKSTRRQEGRDVIDQGMGNATDPTPWPIVGRLRAAMFVWARIPPPLVGMGSVKPAFAMMQKAHVAVAPGGAFGVGGEGYLRMPLVENEKRLRQAVRQIGRAFPLEKSG